VRCRAFAKSTHVTHRRIHALPMPGRRQSCSCPSRQRCGGICRLAEYLATRIWQKLGAESDAAWAIDPTARSGLLRFIATLTRRGPPRIVLANDGAWNRPADCAAAVASRRDGGATEYYPRNTTAQSWGYGYQVWILSGERRMFLLLGTKDRSLRHPQSKLILLAKLWRKLSGRTPNPVNYGPVVMRRGRIRAR